MKIGPTVACTAYYSFGIGVNGIRKDFGRVVIKRPTAKPHILPSMLPSVTGGRPSADGAAATSDHLAQRPIMATSCHLFPDFRERERILNNKNKYI